MANTYLTRTHGASPTNLQKWTFSAWIKRTKLTGANQKIFSTAYVGAAEAYIFFDSANRFSFGQYAGGGSASNFYKTTSRRFRDVSAWYHIQVTWDTTLATAADRIKLYVNGEEQTDYHASANATQNYDGIMNTNRAHYLSSNAGGSMYFEGLMSHVHFTDGYAYAPTAFGETDTATGEWKIKTDPSVTYGNNGFFLFKDNAAVTDQSGNSNDYTLGGGTLTKTEDSPSNNFCTFNPLIVSSYGATMYHANTTIMSEGNHWYEPMATLGFSSGKFYWEANHLNNQYTFIGVVDSKHKSYASNSHAFTTGVTIFRNDDGGEMIKDNVYTTNDYGTFTNDTDVMGIACDMDNKTISIYKNGSAIVSNFALSTSIKTAIPYASLYQANNLVQFNFGNGVLGTSTVSSAGTNASGNGVFEYDVPSGYTALSTKGLNL